MPANLKDNVTRLLNQRIHIVIAGRTLVVKPLYWRVALVVVAAAGLFLSSWWWLGRPVQEAKAFASKPAASKSITV